MSAATSDLLFSIESERVVLGHLLEAPELLDALKDIGLNAVHFSSATHGRIFDAIVALAHLGLPVDTLTVFERLGSKSSDFAVLADILHGCVIAKSHCLYHAEIVKKKFRLRELIRISEWMREAAHDQGADPMLVIDAAIGKLQQCEVSQ